MSCSSRLARALHRERSRSRAACRRYADGAICSTLQIGSTPSLCGVCRSTRTSLESAVELRLGENALASFRISLARRNSLTSRSSSFTRCFSEVVMPSRAPESTSWRRTHSYSVCGTQPIFGAIDLAAAHNEGYSPRCSRTMRTARSRTSGENFVDLFIQVSSQRFYPPRNPRRFISPPAANTMVETKLRAEYAYWESCPDN